MLLWNNGEDVPPISQISKVILHLRKCKEFGVMVIPHFGRCIDLPAEKIFYVPPPPLPNGIFGNQTLKFRMIALNCVFVLKRPTDLCSTYDPAGGP